MKENIYFAKLKEDAKIPSKKEENAGYDIYANFEESYIVIKQNETKMIPTGISSACSKENYFQLFERGSTGTKGIGQRSGVIDSGYRNEWFVPITNHSTNIMMIVKKEYLTEDIEGLLNFMGVLIYPYEKAICQAVLLPVPDVEVKEITYSELCEMKSDRMMGNLGSSDK